MKKNVPLWTFLGVWWRFLRPYTILGTIISSISWSVRAFMENPQRQPIDSSMILKGLSCPFALICVNGFAAGLNQIFDVEIDRVNKPYLPIVAGDLSAQTAWTLVISMAVAGLLTLLANLADPLIIFLYCLPIMFSVLYSVPPFRLKRSAMATCLMIAVTREVFFNICLYRGLTHTLSLPFQWTAPMTFITAFTTLLCVLLGIIKDLPDVKGDRKYKIKTPASELGLRKTTFLSSGLLLLGYAAAISTATFSPRSQNHRPFVAAHVVLALSLVFQVWRLEKAKYPKEECLQFYFFTWGLFYSEYILFPFM